MDISGECIVFVLVPILLITLFVACIRVAFHRLKQSEFQFYTPTTHQYFCLEKLQHVLNLSAALRTNIKFLSEPHAKLRYLYYVGRNDEKGVLDSAQNVSDKSMQIQPNIFQSFGMIKNSLGFVVSNGFLAYLYSYYYKNFAVVQLPFNLPSSLKSMMQNGFQIPIRDSNVVGVMPLYFVLLFTFDSFLFLYTYHCFGHTKGFKLTMAPQTMSPVSPFSAKEKPSKIAQKLVSNEKLSWSAVESSYSPHKMRVAVLKALKHAYFV